MARTRPVRISSAGVRPNLKLVIPLDDPDDTFASVVATCSLSGITIDNEGPTVASVVLNGETIAAGKAITFGITAAANLEDADGYLYFSYVTTQGVQLIAKKRITIYQSGIPLDTEDQ